VNLAIGIIIGSLLPEGAVSFLYYADRIAQLPLGVIGAAVGTRCCRRCRASCAPASGSRRIAGRTARSS
jgi:uncharacterized membrane protein